MTENIDSYFENGKGFNVNPHRKGYLTDEERKEPLRYYGDSFVFFSKTADLSAGLEIYRNKDFKFPALYSESWKDAFVHDVVKFGMWWSNNVFNFLNGFSGFDTIKIEIEQSLGFKMDGLKIPMDF